MAIKDRLRSARNKISPTNRPKLSTSSSTLSASSSRTKISTTSSSTKSSTSTNTSTSSTTTSRLSHLFRPRHSNPTTDAEEEWVHPPLKYSDPPQQEYVDLLAAWDWNSACNHTFSGQNASPQSSSYYSSRGPASHAYGVGLWNGADTRFDARYGYADAAVSLGRSVERAGGRVLRKQRSWDSCVSPGTTSRRGSGDWGWI